MMCDIVVWEILVVCVMLMLVVLWDFDGMGFFFLCWVFYVRL